MGEEDNFLVNSMNGRITLQIRKVKKDKMIIAGMEIALEEMEARKRVRT